MCDLNKNANLNLLILKKSDKSGFNVEKEPPCISINL